MHLDFAIQTYRLHCPTVTSGPSSHTLFLSPGMYYNFEIFHMREKQIPVDSVEIKEQIHAFAWEPVGSKFAIIHGEGANVSVSFYGVKSGQVSGTPNAFVVGCDGRKM
jgi:uncharacterized protein with WD repeat